jgi:hypothetical protein
MTSRDFCYWLQGFFELAHSGPVPPEPQSRYHLYDYQVDMIRNHLAMVFKHEIDPSMGSAIHRDQLQQIHHGYVQAQEIENKAEACLDRSGKFSPTAKMNC